MQNPERALLLVIDDDEGIRKICTEMLEGTSVMRTVAPAESLTGLSSSSVPEAVTMSLWLAGPLLSNVVVNEQVKLAPGASTRPGTSSCSASLCVSLQSPLLMFFTLLPILSSRDVIVTVSILEVFLIVTS